MILERWAEHFYSILNHPSTINDEAIDWLPQVPFDETLDSVPIFEEIWKVIHLLTSSKALGVDSIPTEVYKEAGTALTEKLHQLFQLIWQHETIPQDLKDASIIHLYKCKGNCQACDNHHGISLLSIAGKSLARVLLKCLIVHLERGLLPESQCGFCKEWRTIDMVFAARQLQEKSQEQNVLHLCQSDQGLWNCQQRWPLENHGKVWMPPEIHCHCMTVSWQHAG